MSFPHLPEGGRCIGCHIPQGHGHVDGCPVYEAEQWMEERTRRKTVEDKINHPKHYTQGGIECIEAIEAALTPEEYRGYLKGQIFKYNWRLGHKDEPKQEAGKLAWYAERLKQFLSKG